jgi:hypothetical protein
MRTADLLFLPMHDLPPGERAGLIPYKTFEYLAARRPILAAVPDGDVRDLLAPLQRVSVVRPANVVGMTSALRTHIARAPEGAVSEGGEGAALEQLDRRRCVAQVAAVLDDVLSGRHGASRATLRAPQAG